MLYYVIVMLQDNWYSNPSLDIDISKVPALKHFDGRRSLHLDSCLDHCLTQSRFYIPAPDWSATKSLEVSIGIGPAEMERGDQVAILFGCTHPVILRPEGPSWLCVGLAYAHEMMHGDFVTYWEFLREQGHCDVESEVFEM